MSNEFNSPISRRKMAAEASNKKQFTIPQGNEIDNNLFDDEGQSYSEIEEQIHFARKDKADGIQRLTPEAKKRIEIISGIGRLTKDVDISGQIFTIRTLKSKEMQEATLSGTHLELQVEVAFESRKQFIARSLFKIDNNDVGLILGNNTLEARLLLVDELDDVILTKLFDEFTALNKEAKLKYGITSEQVAKEVSEDLKK